MPRSLLRGDYSLLMAVESSSRPNSWYRVLTDRSTGVLSCDCPPWTFNRNQDAQGNRFCPHTRLAEQLLSPVASENTRPQRTYTARTMPTLLRQTQAQWPGLRGQWSIEERVAPIGTKPYSFVLLRLELGNGGTATGVVAFAQSHHHTQAEMVPGVAGWAGYAIAAEVARLGGFPMAGQPPEHFRVDRRSTARRTQPHPHTALPVPNFGLSDILRVGDVIDQGDGLTPTVRAENTLRLFLGEELYGRLESQGFLDVSSVYHANEQRVYRLRRDPRKERDRRVRVFKRCVYSEDNCIVRGQDVPEADFYLTNFLLFLSDETIALSVVGRYNIFPPNSDGPERETIPATWHPRAMSTPTA